MSNLCRFTGHNLDMECPLDNDNIYNGSNFSIDFEQNSYWNSNSGSNIKSGCVDDRLRRINGPLRINGDVYIEGDIIGQQGAVFHDEIRTDAGSTISDLQTENDLLRSRVDKMDELMQYLSQRFSIDFDNIVEETEKLVKRNNVDKRLDAIG